MAAPTISRAPSDASDVVLTTASHSLGPFWRDLLGLGTYPAYELDTVCVHWAADATVADEANTEAQSGTASVAVAIPTVSTPMAVRGALVNVRFDDSVAEAEFRRFRDNTPWITRITWACFSVALGFGSLTTVGNDVEVHQVRFLVAIVVIVVTATIGAICATVFRRALAVRSRDLWAECGLDLDAHADRCASIRAARNTLVARGRLVLLVNALTVAVGVCVANANIPCPEFAHDPSVTNTVACRHSVHSSHMVPLWNAVVVLSAPFDVTAVAATAALVQLVDVFFLDPRWVAARVAVALVMAGMVTAWAVLRDIGDRRHFAALVAAHVAAKKLEQKHETLAVVVAAMVPRALAARVSAPLLEGVGGGGFAGAEAPTQRDIAAMLGSAVDRSPRATVAVTEAVDFSGFERRCETFRVPLAGLAHLFTLFDIGTNLFEVDRAVVFGDAYVVTAGLVRGSAATALQVVRYGLWQLQLDETDVLPLHTCVATGPVSGSVVGSAGALRYHVGGEVLGRALGAVRGVPAQEVWACRTTRALVREQLAAEHARLSRRQGRPGGAGAELSASVPLEVSPFLGLPDPEDNTPELDAVVGADVAPFALREEAAQDGRPPRGSRESISAAAAVPDGTTEATGAPGGSPTVVQPSLAGSVRDDAPNRPLESSVGSRHSLTRSAVRSQSTRMQMSGALPVHVAVSLTRPHAAPETDGGGDETRSAAVPTATLPHASLSAQAAALAAEDLSALAAGLEVSNAGFAAEWAEAAYRRAPHAWSLRVMSTSVVGCTVAFCVSDWADTQVSPADEVSAAAGAGETAQAYARLLLPVVVALLTGLACLASLRGASRGETVDGLGRPRSAVAQAMSRLLLHAAACVLVGWLWVVPGSFLRHHPTTILSVMVPVLATQTLRGFRWYMVSPVVVATIVNPSFTHGLSTISIQDTVVLAVAVAAFTAMAASASRRRFAARFVADARLRALERVTERLSSLCAGLMPPHVVADSIDDAFAAAVRARVTTAPDEASTAIVRSAASAAPGDEAAAVVAAVAALGKVLGGDYGRERVDHFEWIAVGELRFVPASAGMRAAALGSDKSPLDFLWGAIVECLDAANAGALQPASARAAAGADDGGGSSDAEEPRQGATAPAANPLGRQVPLEWSGSEGEPPGDGPRLGDMRGFEAEASYIRILRAAHDTIVVGGPLYERSHREATAVSAANVARFLLALAPRAREAGFEVCAALVAEEGAGALVGRGTMRYTVVGTALRQAHSLASSLVMSFTAPGREAATGPGAGPDAGAGAGPGAGAAVCNRHFGDQVGVAADLHALLGQPLGFDAERIVGAAELPFGFAAGPIGVMRPRKVVL